MRSAFAIAAAAVVLLAGCAGQTEFPSSEELSEGTMTWTATDYGVTGTVQQDYDEVYDSLAEFRDSFVASAQTCDEFVQDDAIPAASESGWCDNTWGLSLYDSRADRDSVLELDVDGSDHQQFVVGTNWLITAVEGRSTPDLAVVQVGLGGTLWDFNQPIPE